jgi:hydroxypyruvate reductase
VARDAGLSCVILGNAIEGEARDVGIVHGGIARQCGDWGQPLEIPCVLISGGETTVTMRGDGRGGRNAEFLLSLAIAADGMNGIWALAADTDGIDGSEDNAGAILTPDTLSRARASGINAKASLANNDAFSVFAALDDLVVTGPTLTNVNDFRAIVVTKRN